MIVVAVFVAIALFLFVGAFITKRRFGLLGLALTAGATLSGLWSYDAGLLVASLGVFPQGPLTNALVLSAIVLLPAVLLLFHGYTYKKIGPRFIGALLFTVLSVAFLIEPIGFAMPLEGVAADVYTFLVEYRDVIIGVGVVFAIIDLFFTKPAKPVEKDGKKH